MPRGQPDYQVLETETTHTEIGAINGNVYDIGFSRFDGGGRIVWFDDFRNGMYRCKGQGSNGGAIPVAKFISGNTMGFGSSIELDPLVNGGSSVMNIFRMLPTSGNVGIEFGFHATPLHGNFIMNFVDYISNAAHPHTVLSIWEPDNDIKISSGGNTITVYDTSNPTFLSAYGFSLKLVINPLLGSYHSLWIANSRIDLSSYPLVAPGNGQDGICEAIFSCTGTASYHEPFYIDYVAISADEP